LHLIAKTDPTKVGIDLQNLPAFPVCPPVSPPCHREFFVLVAIRVKRPVRHAEIIPLGVRQRWQNGKIFGYWCIVRDFFPRMVLPMVSTDQHVAGGLQLDCLWICRSVLVKLSNRIERFAWSRAFRGSGRKDQHKGHGDSDGEEFSNREI